MCFVSELTYYFLAAFIFLFCFFSVSVDDVHTSRMIAEAFSQNVPFKIFQLYGKSRRVHLLWSKHDVLSGNLNEFLIVIWLHSCVRSSFTEHRIDRRRTDELNFWKDYFHVWYDILVALLCLTLFISLHLRQPYVRCVRWCSSILHRSNIKTWKKKYSVKGIRVLSLWKGRIYLWFVKTVSLLQESTVSRFS